MNYVVQPEARASQTSLGSPTVSVVMPVLNEEDGLGACIEKIQRVFRTEQIAGEIVVCDNGSTDRSVEIAESMGVRVVHQPNRGYGNAYLCGFANALGDYIVMGDADDTYDYFLIPQFLKKLDEGFDFVTGSRYAGGGHGHITFLHRYLGNPLLTLILNVMFGTKYTDVYCGFRAFTKEAYRVIEPLSPGMEFNLELAINAQLASLKIAEIPIVLAPRKGESKLNTFRDGWRSLRMMLLYCPNKVFVYPGVTLVVAGALLHILALCGLQYQGRTVGASGGTSVIATILAVIGVQILSLGLHAKTYSWSRRFARNKVLGIFYKYFTLESGLCAGTLSVFVGIIMLVTVLAAWWQSDFGPISQPQLASLSATFIIIGCNIFFSSLFISAMSMRRNDQNNQLIRNLDSGDRTNA